MDECSLHAMDDASLSVHGQLWRYKTTHDSMLGNEWRHSQSQCPTCALTLALSAGFERLGVPRMLAVDLVLDPLIVAEGESCSNLTLTLTLSLTLTLTLTPTLIMVHGESCSESPFVFLSHLLLAQAGRCSFQRTC